VTQGAVDGDGLEYVRTWKLIARHVAKSEKTCATLARMGRANRLPVWTDHRGTVFARRAALDAWLRGAAEEDEAMIAAFLERVRTKPHPGPDVVYFVEAGAGGDIKIGTTRDLRSRLRTLQATNSCKLTVLATVPGDRAVENEIHRMFFEERKHYEWFKRTRRLMDLIGSLANA